MKATESPNGSSSTNSFVEAPKIVCDGGQPGPPRFLSLSNLARIETTCRKCKHHGREHHVPEPYPKPAFNYQLFVRFNSFIIMFGVQVRDDFSGHHRFKRQAFCSQTINRFGLLHFGLLRFGFVIQLLLRRTLLWNGLRCVNLRNYASTKQPHKPFKTS